ncbi:MAG TPA: hypothetical protein VJI32_06750 [Candidatus Nanoarchaeia archaeon]|nr:hypothetical protein [Candidatus Woesearchaeota archaeon]HLC71686.1 hypothetical protein [Candidatus Nanoarchaeia archaeon]
MLLEETLQEVSHRYSSSPAAVVQSDEPREEIQKDLEKEVEGQSGFSEEEILSEMILYGNNPALEAYSGVPLDYDSLFYGPARKVTSGLEKENEYQGLAVDDTESETMSTEEAEATLKEIQYAQVTGTFSDVDYTERRRFATWALFNSAERELKHSIYAVTSNVDYSRTF